MWKEEESLEVLEVIQEVQKDLGQLKPNVILETMKGWIPGLIKLGYRILIVCVILAVGFRIARIIQKMLGKTLDRMEIEVSVKKFLQSAVYALVCGLAFFVAAERLGISSASIIALLGSAGLALSLSLQNMLGNFAGGVVLLMLKPFKIGDYIICGEEEGTVSAIGLVYTTLLTMDNRQIILPNGSLSNSSLINVTAQKRRRLEIKVLISYQSDLKKAKEILRELFEGHALIDRKEGVVVFVNSLEDNGVMLGVRAWVSTEDYWNVKWELTEKMKLSFDRAGIEISHQQVTVYQKHQ